MAYYKKMEWEKEISREKSRIRKGFHANGGVICQNCFNLKNEIDLLKVEIARLKAALNNAQKVTRKDIENAHTPSSARRYKIKATEENLKKVGGAPVGHKGHGRQSATRETADQIRTCEDLKSCPCCGGHLELKQKQTRTVVETEDLHAEKVLYEVRKKRCANCKKVFTTKPPSVLPKFLYGNQLLSQAMTLHYVHGISLGRIQQIFGPEVKISGIIRAFHKIGSWMEKSVPQLINQYRSALVRHADETGWRTDGRGGYAWLFTSSVVSVFEFTNTRSSEVPKRIFGEGRLPGVLVVDRYQGYNKMPVDLQYCYAHLLRDVEKLFQDFGDDEEVKRFTSNLIPLLATAMKLRGQDINDEQYYIQAQATADQIKAQMKIAFKHLGIRSVQQLFLKEELRLYHWVKSRDIPADNNYAEREIRPTVIARKVSFGSQSKQGCKTRSAIMSVLYTAKKRLPSKVPVEQWLKSVLDQIAMNPDKSIYDLLPKSTTH